MVLNPINYIWPGIIGSQALYTAAKLEIPDLLASGPKTVAELSHQCHANNDALERLLRALATLDLFAIDEQGMVSNTEFTELLRKNHPDSRRDSVLFLPSPLNWGPIGKLYESVRTGIPAFEQVYGQSFFEYLRSHPEDEKLFTTTMTKGSTFTSSTLIPAFDFRKFTKVADIGGGEGAFLRDILTAFPSLEGILFDLPSVVKSAAEILEPSLMNRCKVVGGSFFDWVPPGADLYILKGIIHDWTDGEATVILRNIRASIAPGGEVLIVENPIDSKTRPAGLADLMMLVIGGRERTVEGYAQLLERCEFQISTIVDTELSSMIVAVPT